MTGKRYDRAYFDRWYRNPRSRIWTHAAVSRKVRMVLGVAEHVLGRSVRSVLDVGCGEGSWQPILKRLRPSLRYVGVDDSEYVVKRFGRRRNIRYGRFGDLGSAGLRGGYDLIVCCDVLHYVPDGDLERGLGFLGERARGVVYLEAYTRADQVEGDRQRFHRRAASTYRRLFERAGFVPCGLQCYVPRELAAQLTQLETAAPAGRSGGRRT